MTICARGAGRGYGDVALNDGQALLDMSAMNRILAFDEAAALITVQALSGFRGGAPVAIK